MLDIFTKQIPAGDVYFAAASQRTVPHAMLRLPATCHITIGMVRYTYTWIHTLGTSKSFSRTSHRESAADVSDEDEGVVFEVAHHGVAASQLCGSAVTLVIVADRAVPHHR